MPKQADIRVQVPCCNARTFWDVVYERPEATERYHTSFNLSTSTSVTPWTSCQRTVNFMMPLKLPEFLKRMVGLDSVAVTEVQRAVWHGGGSFTVSSETNITNMIGAGRFTTALQLTVTEQQQQPAVGGSSAIGEAAAASEAGRPGSGGGCAGSLVQLVYSVRCAASSMPWPMSATIENVMSEKALVSMQSFLDFCLQLLEEHAVANAAAASAAALTSGDTGALSPSAASATLAEPAARLSESGAVTAMPAQPAGAALAFPSMAAARGSMRHRWPSITCSQDVSGIGVVSGAMGVGVAGGDSFVLHRQDTQGGSGGPDVFWDAPETFTSAGCGSGLSSGAVSPRQLLLQQSASLRRLSGEAAAAPIASAASAVAVNAVATETHLVAVAVDKLAAAVASLDGKLERLMLLQEQRHDQVQQHLLDMQRQQQQQQQEGDNTPGYLLDHPPGPRRGSGSSGNSGSDARADVRWMLRVSLAVLLATLLIMAYWVLHPYSAGFRPHGGGGGGSPPVPLVSVLRVDTATRSLGGRAAGAGLPGGAGFGGDDSDGDGGVRGNGGGENVLEDEGGAVDRRMRVALQVAGRRGGLPRGGSDSAGGGAERVQGGSRGKRGSAGAESRGRRKAGRRRQGK